MNGKPFFTRAQSSLFAEKTSKVEMIAKNLPLKIKTGDFGFNILMK